MNQVIQEGDTIYMVTYNLNEFHVVSIPIFGIKSSFPMEFTRQGAEDSTGEVP